MWTAVPLSHNLTELFRSERDPRKKFKLVRPSGTNTLLAVVSSQTTNCRSAGLLCSYSCRSISQRLVRKQIVTYIARLTISCFFKNYCLLSRTTSWKLCTIFFLVWCLLLMCSFLNTKNLILQSGTPKKKREEVYNS